ncbi:MBL fold metallo-hydrolase [Risungbinella massiliensis]|uniref:MBL fold metallo-hydrolase n=1 Tax=Risungbinella massiliensis TaxID=1329796 RepID=UPI0005CBC529|nr:MBL fold metallo-hydrolase [Risungbinella massiliensis]
MKIRQISEHVWSLRTWMLIPIHVWVVVDEEGVTLVDAGLSMMAKGILKFIDQLEAGPLQRIVLTHGHSDHVGAVKKIVEATRVPVYAHRIEIPYMEGDLPYPGRKKATPLVARQLSQALPEDDQGKNLSIGGLTPYLTPGHSPGHVVYFHEEDGVLLAGDLFTSKKGKLYRPIPMFTADMKEAVKSSSIVRKLQPKRLEVCHGDSVMLPTEHLDEYIQKTTDKYIK